MQSDVVKARAKRRPFPCGFLNPIFPKGSMASLQHVFNPRIGLHLGHCDQFDTGQSAPGLFRSFARFFRNLCERHADPLVFGHS